VRDLYDATVPVFTSLLGCVHRWLDKASELATAKHFPIQVLLDARLAPDQYRFTQQIQSACDYAKFGVAKLTGTPAPSHPDTEVTTDDLRRRLDDVIQYVSRFTRADFGSAESRLCSHSWMDGRALRGGDYLDRVVLPNFHFHLTSGYAILRHNGVALAKMDYLGALPYVT